MQCGTAYYFCRVWQQPLWHALLLCVLFPMGVSYFCGRRADATKTRSRPPVASSPDSAWGSCHTKRANTCR